MRLFTTVYPESDSKRLSEFEECLNRNLSSHAIGELCILEELTPSSNPASHPKVRTRPITARPTYTDFFTWINELAGPDDISLIANSDIYFDASLAVVEDHLQPGECYALSRWDVRADGSSRLFDRNDSQDAWIFRGPIREELNADFPLGVPRCDNRLLHELQEAGYMVRNPAFSIRAHHLHAGERPEYGESGENFVDPPYAYLFPHNLKSLRQTLRHNRHHPDRKVGWRFDRRGAARVTRQVARSLLFVQGWKRREP